MTPEEQIASLKQEVADLKAEKSSLLGNKSKLESQLKAQKDENDALGTQLTEVKKTLPGDDVVVVKKSDYDALKASDEAKAKNVDELTAKNKSLENREFVRSVAGQYNPDAIIAHTPMGAIWEEYNFKDKDGNEVKSARLVESIDGKEVKTALNDWAKDTSAKKFVDFTGKVEAVETIIDAKGADRTQAKGISIFSEFITKTPTKETATYSPYHVGVVDKDVVKHI